MNNSKIPTIEEQMAWQQYAAGSQAALGFLWKSHARYLAFHALRYARRDHDLADDALGELGAKLAKKSIMQMYRPAESWRHWTRCILRNIVRDLMRRKYRPQFQVTKTKLKQLVKDGVNRSAVRKLERIEGRSFWDDLAFERAASELLSPAEFKAYWTTIRERIRCGPGFDRPLHDNQEADCAKPMPPGDQAAWNEFRQAFQRVLSHLPGDLRAIFVMHVCLGWSFIRIASVLHGERDANLVSRPFYKARALVKTEMAKLGHDGSPPDHAKMHTSV